MICCSSGGFARHLVINQLAPRPTSQQGLTDSKNCVLPSVRWPRKSDREVLVIHNDRSQRFTEQARWKPAKVITIFTPNSALYFDASFET